jgi:long-chain acyl-CoA synthetase
VPAGSTRCTPLPPEERRPVDVLASEDPVRASIGALAAGDRLLLRTSGSSGPPREVVRTASSWAESFPVVSRLQGLTADSAVWVPGPVTATMNLFAAVHAVHTGARLVGRPVDATHAVLTPAALDRALVEGGSLPAGVRVVVAGDRLDRRLHDRAVAAGLEIGHYYGAAELSFVAWGTHADDLLPFPGVDVESREGVLWVRSPYVAEPRRGAAGGPFRFGPDGFATVGDHGVVQGGRVVVHGRGDDAVTTAGATVLVADVEAVLRPRATGDLVVVPVPHGRLGAVVACVLTHAGDHRALRRIARERLDPAARPRLWLHLARLPVGAHGKVDRSAVRELVAAGRLPRLT